MSEPGGLRPSRARASALVLASALGLTSWLGGCGRDIEVGFDDELRAGGSGSGGGGGLGGLPPAGGGADVGGAKPTGGEGPCEPTLCRGKPYQCGNCQDDDDDGASDSSDVDCLGPCDDDESGLSTGLVTATGSPCRQDCYFDGDSGQGNDKCEWSHACDPLSVEPDFPPSGDARCAYTAEVAPMGLDCAARRAAQPQSCLDVCLPLVPNGCDCFGCCELPGRSGNFYFVAGTSAAEGCNLDVLEDPARCPPCTPVRSCLNDCEACERCVATPPDVTCSPTDACPEGSRACDEANRCDFGDYCVTGCCVRAPEPI